jgi:long-chain fatty acid transport protein
MSRKPVPVILSLLLLAATEAFPSSFSIFENGVRASGMAGAFTALATDGSALFYNPAGIAFQPGTRTEMDGLAVAGLFRFKPSDVPAGTQVPEKGFNLNVRPHVIPVASMYMTRQMSERLTFGFGMFAPFGLAANATNFKDSDAKEMKYVGRFSGTRAALQSFWFQPTVAYRVTPNSAIAVGVAWVHTHLLIEQSILNPLDDGVVFGEELASKIFPDADKAMAGKVIARLLPEGRSRLAGTSDKPGFNFGWLYRHPKSGASVGFMWRSAVAHKLDGKASFAFTTGYALEPFVGSKTIPDLFPTQKIKGLFTTPATFSLGFAKPVRGKTTLAVDVQMQDYKRFKDVPVNFSQTEGTATPAELKLRFKFRHSYIARVGMERPFRDMVIRAGYFYDYSPVEDASVGPLFPDANRHNVTFGFSRRMFGNWEASFFYQAMKMLPRTTNVAENNKVFTNGEYLNFVHLFGMGMRIHLGATTNAFEMK